MAKTANLKKQKPNVHSRAARRASSPSINVDRSITSAKPPTESMDHRPSILAIHHGAGVSKKAKRGRAVSSRARKRQEKGLEKAELVLDRLEKKIEKSADRARTVKDRRAAWKDLNDKITASSEEGKEDAAVANAQGNVAGPDLIVALDSLAAHPTSSLHDDHRLEDATDVPLPEEDDEIL